MGCEAKPGRAPCCRGPPPHLCVDSELDNVLLVEGVGDGDAERIVLHQVDRLGLVL